jgi:hypothetical protein
MGLDGSVMCRCYAEGKVKPLPFSGKIIQSEDGLDLDEPYEGNEERYQQFHEWVKTACEHPFMHLVCESWSWSGVWIFRQTLEFAGRQHFPTLLRVLPEGMRTTKPTPITEAFEMLEELNFFCEKAALGWATVLVNSDTGTQIAEFVAASKGTAQVRLSLRKSRRF